MGARLADRIALITGAASGIGFASVERFVREGATVIGIDSDTRTSAEVAAAAKRGGAGQRAEGITLDLTDTDAVLSAFEALAARHGRFDVVYSNAGVAETGGPESITPEEWRKSLEVNLTSQFMVVKAALGGLQASDAPAVILTSSEQGFLPATGLLAYVTAKGAIPNLVRALALELRHRGVRVNAIAPGPIDTPMLRGWLNEQKDQDAMLAAQLRPVLLGRLGRPEEIAAVAVFLASDESSFVTGHTLVTDGGLTSWAGL